MATVSTTIELVDKITTQLNNIKGAVDEVQGALDDINGSQSNLDKFSWKTFLDNAEKAGKQMEKIGKTMTVAITTPLVLLGKKMYGNAVDYESAYVGMTKTVEGTEEQYAALVETAKELSETTPMGYTELMGIAQTGGNLGVAIDDMETFMRSYAQLQYATDQHISGESGAQDVASFLNITEGGVQNIDRFGSSIVHLGNNFNATEDQIISMGNRMASAGHLAGFATPEILGMATAFTAVGIRAEAGGSAASKLIKQFQLSAEVGGQAQRTLDAIGQHFDSGLEFSNYLAGLKKDELVGIADQLNMTTEAVQSMADSWLLMDQFAQVSGKTAQQFVDDWSKDPARAMGDFFTGLSNLGDDGADSILSTLDRMGLTEIRESNLIAAMASRPELFISAIQAAVEAYGSNTAMMEEFNKQMETQESQNAMLGNKMDNTMANFGDNLVQALQPALDLVNDLLDKFNSLSEVDQTHIIELLGALAITGPVLTAVGKTVEAVTGIAKGIQKLKNIKPETISKVLGAVSNFALNTPVGNFLLISGAVAGIAAALESIPTDAEKIWESLQNIPITVDEESVQETLDAIQKVKDAAEGLKNPELVAEYENTSAAVSLGYGTSTMFGSALGYEATKANTEIDAMIAEYSGKLREYESNIANATTDKERTKWFGEYEQTEAAMNQAVAERQALYSEKVSELFNGMASQYPEAAAALERANQEYDLLGTLMQVGNFDWSSYADDAVAQADWNNLMKTMYSKAFDLGFMEDSGFTQDQFMQQLDAGMVNNASWIDELYNRTMQGLTDSVQTVSDNPILAGFMQSIFSDDSVMQNLDLSDLQGAFAGIVQALDFKSAFEQAAAAGDVNSFGDYLSQDLLQSMTDAGQNVPAGVGEGITGNESAATSAATTMGTDTIDAANAGLGVNSPSIFMIQSGMDVANGLAQGITSGGSVAIAAISAVSNQTISIARLILSASAGSSIGRNVAMGIANGIRSGQGAVAAAARALAQSAMSALRSSMQIHSPSRVTYSMGEYTVQGFVDGIMDRRKTAGKAIESVVSSANKAWNTAAWSDIALFAGLEHDKLLDDADDAIKISDSDIRNIRDLAEREVINHFTTAEVRVEMNNNNTINREMDLDGIVSYLGDAVSERLEAVAEGVYS